MKMVKVYTIMEEERPVLSTQQYLRVISLTDTKDWAMVGPEEMMLTEDLPIQRYCWSNGREIFAAMSREAREVIGIEVETIEEYKREVAFLKKENSLVSKFLKESDSKLQEYDKMSFWQRVKWAFKGE